MANIHKDRHIHVSGSEPYVPDNPSEKEGNSNVI
jgi:hypothetical protein